MAQINIYSKEGVLKYTCEKLDYQGVFMGACHVSVSVKSAYPIPFAVGDYISYRGEYYTLNYKPDTKKNSSSGTSIDSYTYDNIIFQSVQDETVRCKFRDFVLEDNTIHFTQLSIFTFYDDGSLFQVRDRIQANLDRLYIGDNKWTIEVAPGVTARDGTAVKDHTYSVSNMSVWDILAEMNTQQKVNFVRKGRTIIIGAQEMLTDKTKWIFGYGDGNMLTSIETQTSETENVITRMHAYGNSTNMPYRYYNKLWTADDIAANSPISSMNMPRLCLPYFAKLAALSNHPDGSMEYAYYDNGFQITTQANAAYIYTKLWKNANTQITIGGVKVAAAYVSDVWIDSVRGIAKYEIKEDDVYFDTDNIENIYPSMKFMIGSNTVTGQDSTNDNGVAAKDGLIYAPDGSKALTFTVTIPNVGFSVFDEDVKTGETPQLSMTSGMCGSRNFDINHMDAIKDVNNNIIGYTLECKRSLDQSLNLYYPYNDYHIKSGDSFTFVNIFMSNSYVEAASSYMLGKALIYLSLHDTNTITIKPTIDNVLMAEQIADEGYYPVRDIIKEGLKLSIIDNDLSVNTLSGVTISSLTIKEGEGDIPEYEITLSDDKEADLTQRVVSEIKDYMTVAGGGINTSEIAAIVKIEGQNRFVSKLSDDEVNGNINFKQDITVDGQALLNDVVANTGTFGGLLKAAAATITGALLASTVSATTMNANTFIGELQGNAATATKLKTARTIWGQSFDGTGNVDGNLTLTNNQSLGTFINVYGGNERLSLGYTFNTAFNHNNSAKIWTNPNGDISLFSRPDTASNIIFATGDEATGIGVEKVRINTSGNVGIGTVSPTSKLDVNGDIHSSNSIIADTNFTLTGGLLIDQGTSYVRLQGLGKSIILNANKVGIGTIGPTATLDVNGTVRVRSYMYVNSDIVSTTFVSHTTGWNINSQGAADFRNIYADELRVQAFTADISQALAGSDYLTKSVSKLSANFVVPAVNSTVRIIVDDIEGMPATQCFTNGDYIRFRAFNRTSGLTIANVWGTVVLDTTFGTNGYLNGTQAYTFTCKATSGAGLTVFKGSEVLDYGTSGSGMISRTTLDAQGSPYEQIATWVNDPSVANNYTVHARLGNLGGIANCNGYGLYTDNGFFTGKIIIGDLTKTANFLSFDNVNGLQVKIGGTSVATTTDVSTAQTTAINTASSDATAKANAAYSNAVTYTNTQITATNNSITAAVNGIQIGGRNLARHTATPLVKVLADVQNSIASLYPTDYNAASLNVGDSFTMSFDVTTSSDFAATGTGTPFIYLQSTFGRGFTITSKFVNGAQKVHVTLTNTVLLPDTHGFQLRFDYYVGTVTFTNFMLEKSTKESSWSPAPEDVDANIATAQSTAVSTAATNAASLYVTQTAYSSQVTILQNSINAKVSQTDFNALGTRVGTAESTITQHSTDIASKVAQTDYTGNTIASLINQTATTVAINASKINLVGAVTFSTFDSNLQTSFNDKASISSVTTAQNAAEAAQSSANTANSAIAEMTSDDKVTAQEKQAMKTEWDSIVSEKTKNDTQADNFGVSRTTYDSTYNTLSTAIGANLSNLTTTWDLGSGGGATLRSQFKAYYDARTDLLNSISTKAKTLADAAKTTADNAQGDATSALTRNNTMAVKLGYTDYTALASAAALGHTLIDGGFINTQLIQAVAVVTNGLTANCITANMIASGAVTADKIYSGAVTTDKLYAGAVTATTIAAGAVTTDKLYVGAVTADKIAANTITGDKINATSVSASIATVISLDASRITTGTLSADRIAANSITFGKLVGTDITALGNVTAGSFNIGSGKFVVDANGNTTTVNMNAVNATISGTLSGVSGTFDYLKAVGSTGRLVFGSYGMTFEDEDFSQQGTKNSRALRFYSGNIRCRGSFGTTCLNMARVHDAVIDYYVNGDTNSYVRFNLQSNGVGGYYVPLYVTSDTGYSLSWNAALSDVYGFPVDLVVFDNTAVRQYELLAGATGKKVTLVNAHDGSITVNLAINGNLSWALYGGAVQQYVNIRELTNPLISSSVHGAGWLMISDYDNNWA